MSSVSPVLLSMHINIIMTFCLCLFLGTQGHSMSESQAKDHTALSWRDRAAHSNSGALSSLLDGLQLSSGPSLPLHKDVSPIARLSSKQDSHGIISKRINPNDMFSSLTSESGHVDTLIQGSSGYSSGMSGQQLSGVFVGYSTNQGSSPGDWEMTFSGAVEGTNGELVQGREPRLPSAVSDRDQPTEIFPQKQLQQNQHQQQQRPPPLPQHQQQQQQQQQQKQQQQQQQIPNEQQQKQGQQQQEAPSGFNQKDGSHNATGYPQPLFSKNENLQSGLSAASTNDMKPADLGGVSGSQQTNYQQGQIGNYQSLTQIPDLKNPQPLLYPQQFGNTDQLSHQATFVPDTLMGKLGNSNENLPSPLVDRPNSNVDPSTQSKQEDQDRGDKLITTGMDSIKEQLDSLQKLISQLQQQQQELSRLQEQQQRQHHQQQQQQQQQPVARTSTQPPTVLPTSPLKSDLETTEIGTSRPKGEEGGQNSDNDFGNTAGAQNAVSGDNMTKQQQPVFVAGGPKDGSGTQENTNLYNNNNNNNNYAPTPTSSINVPEQTYTDDTSISHTSDVVRSNNISTPKPFLPTASGKSGADTAFDPQAVNDLAKQKFNPLNPLYGVDLQQYLGYQTGSGNGGFDATKLNTQLAQQGMQLGSFSNNQSPQTGEGNSAQTMIDYGKITTDSHTSVDAIIPETTAASTSTLTSSAPTSKVEKTSTQTTTISTPKPSQPATVAPVVAQNQTPVPSVKPNKAKPEFGDVGGGLNLMNPSSMIGMMSSGKPVMAGNKPGDIFRLDNDQGMFGTGIWESTGQNQQPSNQLSWFGTNGPAQRLTVPLMANPLDPLGVMSSANRRRRSTSLGRRIRRQTNNVDISSISKAFGFDPNQFFTQAADRSMNNGLGGCCPTNVDGMQVAVDSGHYRNALTISRMDSSTNGASTHFSSESDFGNTATSAVRSTDMESNPYRGRGTKWIGQWPNSMSASSSSNDMTSFMTLDSNGGEASKENRPSITTWDGSWMSRWPGSSTNQESGYRQDLPKPGTSMSRDSESKKGNAIAMVIARNMAGNTHQARDAKAVSSAMSNDNT